MLQVAYLIYAFKGNISYGIKGQISSNFLTRSRTASLSQTQFFVPFMQE